MSVINRVVKPTTHRGKRAILKKEPKLIEDAKQALFFRGVHSSQTVIAFMKDLYHLRKPFGLLMTQKKKILPFDDATTIEKFSSKYTAPLFMVALHSKKRPHNLVMGRTYEHTLLDMVEFGVENYKGLSEFPGPKITSGIKPSIFFYGEQFENNYEYSRIKNLLVDIFHKESTDNVAVQGLEHCICFIAVDSKICVRSFLMKFKVSDSRKPRIQLEEIGPRADLKCRRTKLASEDLFKEACKKPKQLKIKKKKNISKDNLGTTFGRIHVGAQSLNSIQTRKMKGLKKTMAEKKRHLA